MQNSSNEACLLKQAEKQGLVAKEFGFYWENFPQLIEQIQSECIEIQEAWDKENREHLQEEVGDLIQAAIELAVFCKLDPRETLSKSIEKFQRRYDVVVQLARSEGYDNLHQQPFEILMDYWNRAKIKTNASEWKMHKEILAVPEIKLVGICVRTSNERERDKMKGNIFPCVQKYFHQGLAEKISNRKRPGTTFCAYTGYETDHNGEYTYFIGEEVSELNNVPEGFQQLVVPKQQYAKFTTTPAPMPDVIVNAWKEIWEMSPKQLGGHRSYETDFEVYDERAADHQNIVLDLNIGIEP